MCQVSAKTTVVLSSAILPQAAETNPCLPKGKECKKCWKYCTTIPGGRSGSQHLFSFQELLDFAVHNGLDFPPKRKVQTKSHAEIREQKVRRRLRRILKEVKTECGDSNASSEDDGQYFSCFLTILFFFFLHAFLLQEFTNRFRTKGSFDWGLELKVPK